MTETSTHSEKIRDEIQIAEQGFRDWCARFDFKQTDESLRAYTLWCLQVLMGDLSERYATRQEFKNVFTDAMEEAKLHLAQHMEQT